MSFDPKSFITVSKELNVGVTEAHYRSVINRAYYGAFGYIRSKLPFYLSGPSVHQDLIKSLINSPSINEKKAGKKLEALFKKRKEADYEYNREFRQNTCDYTIKEAEATIKLYDTPEDD